MKLDFNVVLELAKIRLFCKKHGDIKKADFIRDFIINNSDYTIIDTGKLECSLLLNLIKYRPEKYRVTIL